MAVGIVSSTHPLRSLRLDDTVTMFLFLIYDDDGVA